MPTLNTILIIIRPKGLKAFRSDEIKRFIGHIVFIESLNGPRIALNILMNEAFFFNGKNKYLLH
jgi:hypothetical protein